jgi:hypothetical protein
MVVALGFLKYLCKNRKDNLVYKPLTITITIDILNKYPVNRQASAWLNVIYSPLSIPRPLWSIKPSFQLGFRDTSGEKVYTHLFHIIQNSCNA